MTVCVYIYIDAIIYIYMYMLYIYIYRIQNITHALHGVLGVSSISPRCRLFVHQARHRGHQSGGAAEEAEAGARPEAQPLQPNDAAENRWILFSRVGFWQISCFPLSSGWILANQLFSLKFRLDFGKSGVVPWVLSSHSFVGSW